MKILFLSRVHPPIIGGLENQSYNLVENFKKINKETFIIANTKGKKALPYFIPLAYKKALEWIRKNKITHLHLSDGVLAPIGERLKNKTGVKTIITVHGLDITYHNTLYQKIIPKSINQLDKIICISENTKSECIKRGISEKIITIIPNGINADEFFINKPKSELIKLLTKKLNINLENKKILLTVGRLIKRKGVAWFIANVMTRLDDSYIYLISGEGEERKNIELAIKKNNLKNVFLLGKTDFETLKSLYNASDLFIMPNIPIKGDVEGFGIVIIEAGSCGLPVIASNIDGIKDAIIEGKTGWLIKEKDADDFITKIKMQSHFRRDKVREEVLNNFDWRIVSKKYAEVMR